MMAIAAGGPTLRYQTARLGLTGIQSHTVSDAYSRMLEEMFRSSPDALIVVGADGLIEGASPAVERIFGYRPEELDNQPIELLVPEDRRSLHRSLRAGYSEAPEERPMGLGRDLLGRHRDGSVFPVDVSLVPSAAGGRPRIGAFVRDSTERRRSEDVLRFVNDISRGVIAGEPTPDLLAMTAQRARLLVGAAAAWISVQAQSGDDMVVAAVDGDNADQLAGAVVPVASSIAARAMRNHEIVSVSDMAADPDVLTEARDAGFGAGLYLPMQAEYGPVGSLVLARRRGERAFDPGETQSASVFASAAAIVLALGSARASLEKMRISSEHERIARDLHDTVIQRLFGLGMRLQAAERLADGPVAERIRSTVDSIDEVIREIRETIFDLNRPESEHGTNLRDRFREVLAEAGDTMGFRPRVAFRGPVESAIGEDLLVQILSVLRESLSNVGKHAHARSVDVVLSAADGRVVLSVADDGVGITGDPMAGHGLLNMAARAEKLGGEMEVSQRSPSGTLLQWRVPLATSGA